MGPIAKTRFIPISTPSVGDEEWQALREPLRSGWLTQGPQVKQFETQFAAHHQLPYALATTSCTTALHLALTAIGVGPGDEVIVPAFTWIATANVVLYCGATPIFCDIDSTTYNLCTTTIQSKLSTKTKAIIPVHLFGLCADVDSIRNLMPTHVKIIEDAACAAGASYKHRSAGTLGDVAAFSFHPRKSITCGEGGMITTSQLNLFTVAKKLRNHGAEISEEIRHLGPKPHLLPDFKIMGFNYRMTELQAAVGIVQLSKLNAFISERQKWANYYHKMLSTITWLKTPTAPSYITQHAWQAYVCYVDPKKAPLPRNVLMERLKQKGIATRPGTHAVHALNFYRDKYHFKPEDFPNAWACDQNTMAIPLHNQMSSEDYAYIVEVLYEFC